MTSESGAAGGMERTGVVLAAVDQFSPTVQSYVDALRRAESAERQLAEVEAGTAAKSAKAAAGFSMSGEKVVKYGMAASVVTGQMQALGVSNEVVARGVSVATDAFTGMLGPIGLAITAIGMAVYVTMNLVTAKKKLKTAIDTNTDSIIAQARETGVANEVERQLIVTHQAAAQVLLQKAQAELAAAQAGQVHLNVWEWLREAFGDSEIRATKLAAKESELALKIRTLTAELKDMDTALRGGSKAMEAAAAGADKQRAAAEAQQKAIRDAEIQYQGLLRERVEAQMEADDLSAAGLARTALAIQASAAFERNAIRMRIEDAREQAIQLELVEIRLQKRLKDLRDKAEADIKRRRIDSEAAEKAHQQRIAAYVEHSMSIVGVAVGETAAGNVKAWKAAAVQTIQIAAKEASHWLAIQAAKHALTNPMLAALYAAGIVAVNAAASKAVADLQKTSTAPAAAGGSSSGGSSGPTIIVYNPVASATAGIGGGGSYTEGAFAPSINLSVHGDARPEQIQLSLRSAQEFLDQHMPTWQARNRRLGRRF